MENGIKLDYTFLEYTHINCINLFAVFSFSYPLSGKEVTRYGGTEYLVGILYKQSIIINQLCRVLSDS